jgi:hypothetical protein
MNVLPRYAPYLLYSRKPCCRDRRKFGSNAMSGPQTGQGTVAIIDFDAAAAEESRETRSESHD